MVCGLYYGAAFVRRKNYCWRGIFDSWYFRDSFTTFIATGWQTNYDVAIFLMPFPEVSVCRCWNAA
ncbi:hypothetical protein J4732_10480 [Serratia marcescens]|uniref:Uncharacterized protein n=1 Tax=Serratia marcescens TaxID=615 RepID=A0A939SV83_SERMA|nr:hypothetical protein [Serratia marcescens]